MTYYIWLTTLGTFGDDKVASTLVKRGYTVKALASKLSFERKGILGVVISLRVHKEHLKKDEKYDDSTVHDEVEDILKFHKLKYISLIVCAQPTSGSARWNVGNIESPEIKEEEDRKKTAN